MPLSYAFAAATTCVVATAAILAARVLAASVAAWVLTAFSTALAVTSVPAFRLPEANLVHEDLRRLSLFADTMAMSAVRFLGINLDLGVGWTLYRNLHGALQIMSNVRLRTSFLSLFPTWLQCLQSIPFWLSQHILTERCCKVTDAPNR